MRELLCNVKYDPLTGIDSELDYRERLHEAEIYNVWYFLKCLEYDRNEVYELVEEADKNQRNKPMPDFVYRSEKSGKSVVIEHTTLFESGKARENLAYKVKKEYERGLIPVRCYIPTPQELGDRLSEFIKAKLDKRQFLEFPNAECILLIRNRWNEVMKDLFIEAKPFIQSGPTFHCEHCYVLLINGIVLEIF